MTKFYSIVLLLAVTFMITDSFAQGKSVDSDNLTLNHVSTVVSPQLDQIMDLLYDQTANSSGNAYTSQDFEAAYDTYDNWAADDFTAAADWSVDQIVVVGSYSIAGPADGFNIFFFTNNGGMPGTEVYNAPSQAYVYDAGAGTFTITLAAPAILTAGDYWVSVQARLDFGTGGQWYWGSVTGSIGNVAKWQNPGGGFGTTCATWGDITSCISATETDMYFALSGTPIVPVELSSFSANVSEGNVILNWTTATETNNKGFEVQKMIGTEFRTLGFVQGNGTSTQQHSYSYLDNDVEDGNYSYRLRQVDFDGTSEYSQVVEVVVNRPVEYNLAQNYPNPFNPSTKINYGLKVDSKVTLKVFDILGQEVVTLLNENIASGNHSVTFDASKLNSGVYLYKIEATGADGSSFSSIKKMILTK